ncbi:hypothetical protein NDU88_000338 [Pleurodeles waltl]|uniref:Hsp90 co-chaperone Cdc37 n=1 Tax=Pleurodeles waltl TaxID=8319 RepID=A0AAV7S5R6_PLEWA|nr:hypothetical protein NDU88_000338 [Pleurodeles waltl]
MVDYSVWDKIEVSDDEDDTHPNIDRPSLFCWRHQAHVEHMEQVQKEKEEHEKGLAECWKKLADCQKKINELELQGIDSAKNELLKLQPVLPQLKKDKWNWEKKANELQKKVKTMPWNVDTLSKDGFSKSAINKKPEVHEET